MSFKYRLQKVLELREQKLEKRKQEFAQQQQLITSLKEQIKANEQEQNTGKHKLATGQTDGMSSIVYINHLKSLENQKEILDNKLCEEELILLECRQLMLKAQQQLEILIKHKDKSKKEFNKLELDTENKEMAEIALMLRFQRLSKE